MTHPENLIAAVQKRMADLTEYEAAATFTTSASPAPTTLTLDTVAEAVNRVRCDQIGEWMRERGFPPETCMCVMPETMRPQLPSWPPYVQFSAHARDVYLMRNVLGTPWARYRK